MLLVMPTISGQDHPNGIPVLVYHRFDPKTPASTTVTTASLESQLAYLSDHGYTIVRLRQVVELVLHQTPAVANPAVAITVDDDHRSVYTVLYPILKQRHIAVTLFIYPSAISNSPYALTWEQLKEMKASGFVDIQSHTYWHPDFRKEKGRRPAADYAMFVDAQLVRSRTRLDAELGTHVDLLAWPYSIVDKDLETAARRAGYRAAFAYDGLIARPDDDPFSIHRVPVSNSMVGPAFEAILRGTVADSSKEKAHAIRE